MNEETKCRGCGAKIVFVKSKRTSKMIPLQKIRMVYRIEPDLLGEGLATHDPHAGVHEDIYVSHFETCPNADDFSGARR